MKEVTYGWYPSAKDVYRPKGRPSTHHQDCLYKRADADLYYQSQATAPEGELFLRGNNSHKSDTAEIRRKRARSLHVPKFSPVPKLQIPTLAQCWSSKPLQETQWGVNTDHRETRTEGSEVSWPLPQKELVKQQQEKEKAEIREQQIFQQKQLQLRQQLQQKLGIPTTTTPQYAWGLKPSSPDDVTPRSDQSDSQLHWPSAVQVKPTSRPQTAASGQLSERQTAKEKLSASQKSRPTSSPVKSVQSARSSPAVVVVPAPPPTSSQQQSRKPSRIQSATVRRDKTPVPSRPVTAGSHRKLSATRKTPTPPPSRPAAPSPFVYDVNNDVDDDVTSEVTEIDDDVTSESHEKIVEKYGWRAEVHGNPYGLKRPTKRISYCVPCPEPVVAPEPPRVHMETNETYFQNTIPRRPATYVVHKEWMSEVLVAKRLGLQQRQGGVKYNYKNFAFVY